MSERLGRLVRPSPASGSPYADIGTEREFVTPLRRRGLSVRERPPARRWS